MLIRSIIDSSVRITAKLSIFNLFWIFLYLILVLSVEMIALYLSLWIQLILLFCCLFGSWMTFELLAYVVNNVWFWTPILQFIIRIDIFASSFY